MNKLSEKIHHQFVSGKINGAVFEYMQKIASSIVDDSDVLLFDKYIIRLAKCNVQTLDECDKYFRIFASAPPALEYLLGSNLKDEDVEKLCSFAFANRNKYNFGSKHNFAKLALDFLKENNIVKNSHPNNSGIEGEGSAAPPYNLDKWVETMRYIYDTANTNNLPLDRIAKQVTAKWDENERINFQRWMKYYQEGNYNKYNVKTAQFFPYKQETTKTPDLKPVKDMFDTSAFPKPDPVEEKKKKLEQARKKLRGRLKSVVELLDQYRDVLPKNDCDDMLNDVNNLHQKVWVLELKASLVDSIIRTSNQFNKRGFAEGANELKKIAQEVAEDKLPEASPVKAVPAPQPAPAEVKDEKENIRVPQVNIGEEKIEIPDFSSATHRDALLKLEEINKVISERNVVRALAAVDIILGQLGIASYFPQLSEAQSKLMDAFNYAGTRVAETIGQMRGGQGGPAAETQTIEKKPKEDTIDVAEETEKPVGEVVPGSPVKAKPATPAPEIK